MKNRIQSILQDLYAIDPSLKQNEAVLAKVIEKLLEAKPSSQIDHDFVAQLKTELDAEVVLMAEEGIETKENATAPGFWDNIRRVLYPLASGAFALILLVVIVNNDPDYTQEIATEDSIRPELAVESTEAGIFGFNADAWERKVFDMQIAELDQNEAFGALTDLAFETGADYAFTTAYEVIDGAIVGSSDPSFESSVPGTGPVVVSAPLNDDNSTDSNTPPPAIAADAELEADTQPETTTVAYQAVIDHQYAYQGEPFDLDEDIYVYRAVAPENSREALLALLLNFGFNEADLQVYVDLDIKELTLSQDEAFGYDFILNFEENTLKIGQNKSLWPEPSPINELPSIKTIQAIVDDFFAENNIILTHYGDYAINPEWLLEFGYLYDEGADISEAELPSYINLNYPLLFDQKPVLNLDGTVVKIEVRVDLAHKKVSSVKNLRAEVFEKTTYQSANWEAIMTALNSGQFYYKALFESNKLISLDTPEIVLLSLPDAEGGREFLIPTLKFPIVNEEGIDYSQDHILVPLLEEVLNVESI